MHNLPLPDQLLRAKLSSWLARASGEGKIVLRSQRGAIIRADYSRVARFRLQDRDRAPDEIMRLVRTMCPEYGSVVVHDRGAEIVVEVSDCLVCIREGGS